MKLTSIIAIYFLIWVLSAFLVMPFGLRTPDEEPTEMVPGQATSAPVNFQPKVVAKRATVLATLLCAFYYLNYVNGWITGEDLDLSWIWN